MKRYYCPFCPTQYQFQKTRSDGVLICGQCGDPLIKKNYINTKQIVGLILSLAFLFPLMITIISLVKESSYQKTLINSISLQLIANK